MNDREGRRAESSNERRRHRQNESDVRRSARLARLRERAAEVREAETVEQRYYRLSWGQQAHRSTMIAILHHTLETC